MSIREISITFPTAVAITGKDQQALDRIAAAICRRYVASHPGRVMWPFGIGSKLTYMPLTRQQEEERGLEFDETIFSIECSEREDFDWICGKCGKPQGDHISCFAPPAPAGECEFEPSPNPPPSKFTSYDIACRAVLEEIFEERNRQVMVEGWTPRHDDQHSAGEMAGAAAAYAWSAMKKLITRRDDGAQPPPCWPWEAKWWKPKDPRRDLIRAAALIVAEIERADRATIRASEARNGEKV